MHTATQTVFVLMCKSAFLFFSYPIITFSDELQRFCCERNNQYCVRLLQALLPTIQEGIRPSKWARYRQQYVSKCIKYNEEFGEECIKLTFHDEKPVVAICTPLMKRVHQLWRYSSEMAFITTTTKLYVIVFNCFLVCPYMKVLTEIDHVVFESTRHALNSL